MSVENATLTSPYALPYVVAVTGHRDIHPDDVGLVQAQIRELIELVLAALPNTPIHFLSALADGADQLFAEQVLDLKRQSGASDGLASERIKLIVPLPLARDEYCREQAKGASTLALEPQSADLVHDAFVTRFSRLAEAADSVFVIPWIKLDDEATARVQVARLDGIDNEPYARLARYLNTHAHLVIAIWDGQAEPTCQFPRKAGGTLDVVLTRLEGFDRVNDNRSARRFAEQERGDVVHIHTRRAGQPDAAVHAVTASEGVGFNLLNVFPGSVEQPRAIIHIREPNGNWPGLRKPTIADCVRTPVRAAETAKGHRAWRGLIAQAESQLARTLDASTLAVLHCVWKAGKEINWFNQRHQRALGARRFVAGETTYRLKLITSAQYFIKTLGPATQQAEGQFAGQSGWPLKQQIDALTPLLHSFSVADVLAENAKRTWRWRWLLIAVGAVVAGASSAFKVLYPPRGDLIETCAFVAGAGLAVITYLWVTLSNQRNAYLEYRALAEGLRFQMYWLTAGNEALVTDYYVQKFRTELGWIRRAIDGLMVLPRTPGGSALAVARGWILDQAAYLDGRENTRRRNQNARATNMGNYLLLLGLTLAVAALIASLPFSGVSAFIVSLLIAGMKLTPAIGAAWLSYNGKLAHGETLKQVEHLRGVYARARADLERIESGDQSAEDKKNQARDLLVALGKEALAENANWLANYQQRKVTWHGR